ncbi:MAG: hypothetical protein HY817_05420 [Candidatus Abawacabacteria bacterium]|nr:hypothetical protein [Candidatus Abawacabacteria bacterium]
MSIERRKSLRLVERPTEGQKVITLSGTWDLIQQIGRIVCGYSESKKVGECYRLAKISVKNFAVVSAQAEIIVSLITPHTPAGHTAVVIENSRQREDGITLSVSSTSIVGFYDNVGTKGISIELEFDDEDRSESDSQEPTIISIIDFSSPLVEIINGSTAQFWQILSRDLGRQASETDAVAFFLAECQVLYPLLEQLKEALTRYPTRAAIKAALK